ncbi:hypothetical protein KGY71_05830 [Candidatus Bipolaricaulota bacterium]|nr:hypothetical protein [Candidatus Bipolaricaulota bacterium]
MLALLAGITTYITGGILSLLHSRYRFWFSLMGWSGALAGLSWGAVLFRRSGTFVGTLGLWGKLGIEIKLDQTTLLFVALVVLLNLFTLLYLGDSKRGTFYALYNFLLASTYSMAFSHDVFNIYVTIEFMSLVAILLIGYGRKTYQIYAGVKYLLVSSLAMSLYLIGLGLIYSVGGYLKISKLAEIMKGNMGFTLSLGLGLMVAGLAVKGGIMLFSMWLPDAHAYSGTVVSALLSGLAIKSGLVGIIRLAELVNWNLLWLILGAMTGITGGVFAVLSRWPKRILAYSTISQIGYVLLGIGAGTQAGLLAAALNIFFHGLFKSLLFLSVGHAGVGGKDLFRDGSLSVPMESVFGLLIGTLSILAIPPFSKYFSKTFLLEQSHRGWVWWVMLFIGLGTATYMLKLNRALVVEASREKFGDRSWPLTVFSIAVALSSLVALVVLGKAETLALLAPGHLLLYLTLPFAALLVLLGIWKRLGELRAPDFPFNLDSALSSVFAGFLVIELVIFLL